MNLRPADYPLLQEWASKGLSEHSIAEAVGVSFNTWKSILERDPKARAAVDRGRAQEHDALVGALYRQALDPKNRNPAPAIFLLKSRHSYSDQPQPEHVENRVSITFEIPGALKPDQYRQLIEVTPTKALREAKIDLSK